MEAKLTSLKKGSQGFVHGAADAITIDDDGAIRVIDWKTGQKSITDENKAQVAVYQAMLEGYRGRLKEIYNEQGLGIWERRNVADKNGVSDETYVNSVIKQFMEEDIGRELKTRFGKDGQNFHAKLLVALSDFSPVYAYSLIPNLENVLPEASLEKSKSLLWRYLEPMEGKIGRFLNQGRLIGKTILSEHSDLNENDILLLLRISFYILLP